MNIIENFDMKISTRTCSNFETPLLEAARKILNSSIEFVEGPVMEPSEVIIRE